MSPLATEMSKLVDLSKLAATEQEAAAFRKQAFELFLQANPHKRTVAIPKGQLVQLYEDELELWNKTNPVK